MPRSSVRRPAPIVLPNMPMDTLWEVDESCDMASLPVPSFRSRTVSSPVRSPLRAPLRSVFEDDDEEERTPVRNVSFPLPPVSLPQMKQFLSSRMKLPIHSPPKAKSAPPTPRVMVSPPRKSSLEPKYATVGSRPRNLPPPLPFPRAPSPHLPSPVRDQRPVSPTSSASSSDTDLPRTPPAVSTPLPAPRKPAYVLAPLPPAEWESAIDALFDLEDRSLSSIPRSAPVAIPRTPPRPSDSYMSWSPEPSSPPRLSFMCMAAPSPLPPSVAAYTAEPELLPMSPTFSRPLGSPGLLPTSPTSPIARATPVRPARSSRRMPHTTISHTTNPIFAS